MNFMCSPDGVITLGPADSESVSQVASAVLSGSFGAGTSPTRCLPSGLIDTDCSAGSRARDSTGMGWAA